MKKSITILFLITLISCACFLISCGFIDNEPYTLTVRNEIDPEELDNTDAGSAAIAPMYLPQMVDEKAVSLSYRKSGLSASIRDGETLLASFTFSNKDTADSQFPSANGEAFVSENNGDITIEYRMSDLWVCEINSSSLSTQELEKVLGSLTVRSEP